MTGRMRWIVSIGVSFLVAAPLLYLHLVGRQAPLLIGYCGVAGPTDRWRYGWPAIYGTRIISQPWLGRPGSTGPLDDFDGRAQLWNLFVAATMIAGTIYVAQRIVSALRNRQFSLQSLLLLPVVTLAVCAFVKYDRAPNLIFFLVPPTPARFDPEANPIIFRPRAITDFPPHLFVPILIGVASATYAVLSATGAVGMRLCRLAFRGSGSSVARPAKWRVLAIAALVCLVCGAACVARSIYRLRTACHATVSGRLATEWLSAYVSLHGEWPNSWDAIRTCLRELPSSDRDQEALIDMAQTYIVIDFQADARKIAGQTVEEFDSIRTLDNYGIDHRDYWQVETLIELLQIWNDIDSKEPCLGATKRPAESNPPFTGQVGVIECRGVVSLTVRVREQMPEVCKELRQPLADAIMDE